MPMGFPSCYENNLERYYNSLHMLGRSVEQPALKPLYVASPPMQPASPVASPRLQLDAEGIEKRRREAREKHMIALAELLPGSRWKY